MSKRALIWSATVLVAMAAVATAFWLLRTEKDNEEIIYQKASGDFLKFYVDRVQKYGGTPSVTNGPAKFDAEWEFTDNRNGFHVFLPRKWKSELVQCFTGAFGEPTLRDQFPQLSYKEDRFNVSITANLESDPIAIVCLKRGLFRGRK